VSTINGSDVREAWKAAHLSPLWESPNAHKPQAEPVAPYKWAWAEIRPLLEYAFKETSPSAVERRVLQLMNPLSRSLSEEFTAGNVLAAIQCLLPGETARPHRHTMNALRFVLEGEGAETIVDGKVCPMQFGDMIITPAWCWHEHRHTGQGPMLWLDALDVPLHNYLGTVEFQPPPIVDLPRTVPDLAFAVPNILPEGDIAAQDHSPVFRYPYADVLRALEAAPKGPNGERRVRYINPATGGPAMSLLESYVAEIDAKLPTSPMRTNSNAVCVVIEGEGKTQIGKNTVSWKPRDIFTLPQWNWISHSALGNDARLLVVTDRETLRKLGLYREQVGHPEA
jgi:gentisate 1,2-dioxygenase